MKETGFINISTDEISEMIDIAIIHLKALKVEYLELFFEYHRLKYTRKIMGVKWFSLKEDCSDDDILKRYRDRCPIGGFNHNFRLTGIKDKIDEFSVIKSAAEKSFDNKVNISINLYNDILMYSKKEQNIVSLNWYRTEIKYYKNLNMNTKRSSSVSKYNIL